jgi:hypothetical protein
MEGFNREFTKPFGVEQNLLLVPVAVSPEDMLIRNESVSGDHRYILLD